MVICEAGSNVGIQGQLTGAKALDDDNDHDDDDVWPADADDVDSLLMQRILMSWTAWLVRKALDDVVS